MEFEIGKKYKHISRGNVIEFLGLGNGWCGLMNCKNDIDGELGYVDIKKSASWELVDSATDLKL